MIFLTECHCPNDHAIVAYMWDDNESNKAAMTALLRHKVAGAIGLGLLNPWCRLCSSRDFRYRTKPTTMKSLEEGAAFAEKENANIIANWRS